MAALFIDQRWANFLAGLRGVLRWFFDMAAVLVPNSTVAGTRPVE
jgi:hypothetical protein